MSVFSGAEVAWVCQNTISLHAEDSFGWSQFDQKGQSLQNKEKSLRTLNMFLDIIDPVKHLSYWPMWLPLIHCFCLSTFSRRMHPTLQAELYHACSVVNKQMFVLHFLIPWKQPPASRSLVSESRSQSTPKWTQMWNFDFSGSKKLHFLSCWCCVQSEKVTSEQLLTVTRGAPSHVPSCSTVEPPDNVVLCEKLHSYDSGCFIVVHDMLTRPNWAR